VLKEGIHRVGLSILIRHQGPVHFELRNEVHPMPVISVKLKELGTIVTLR
jgi:hypothetical protein